LGCDPWAHHLLGRDEAFLVEHAFHLATDLARIRGMEVIHQSLDIRVVTELIQQTDNVRFILGTAAQFRTVL
jgi:hypothetical protein